MKINSFSSSEVNDCNIMELIQGIVGQPGNVFMYSVPNKIQILAYSRCSTISVTHFNRYTSYYYNSGYTTSRLWRECTKFTKYRRLRRGPKPIWMLSLQFEWFSRSEWFSKRLPKRFRKAIEVFLLLYFWL